MTLRSNNRASHRRRENGYVLITLLLTVSLMTIAALAVLPSLTFEIKREQEQEMIHRGVQYSRAIRTFYKKFGRYPTRLEDLENTNNLRYLRKRYKDPLTGKDFKLLHFGDPGLALGGSFGGGTIPGANPIGSPTATNGASSSAFGGSSSFGGGSNFGSSSFGNSGGFGNSGVNNSGVFSQSSSFGGNSNSGFGSSSNSQGTSPQQATATPSGSDSSSTQAVAADGTISAEAPESANQQVFGGGPIVGVASISKKTTIREFNHKKKYNEWQFIYDPTMDRGGLITTPYQPLLGFGSPQNLNPQSGTPTGTSNGSSFGNSFGNSFGQTGMSNNPNSVGGQTPPAQPPSNPPQQQ